MAYGIATKKKLTTPGVLPEPDASGNLDGDQPGIPGGTPDVLPDAPGYQAPTLPVEQGTTSPQGPAVGDVNALTLPVDPTRAAAPATAPWMDILTRGLQTGYGRTPNQQDLDYWGGKWNEWGSKDPNYFEQRILGLGAGGKDVATAGPYAGQDYDKIWANNTSLFDPSMSAAALKSAMGGPSAATTSAGGGLPADAADPNVDPFASIGGGVYANGGWQPKGMATATAPATQAAPGTGATANADGQPDNSPAGIDDSYRQALADILGKPERSPEELAKSPENRAFRLGQQRSEERQRGQIAEQNFAEGTDQSGAMDTDLAGLRQTRGEQEAGFLGNLSMEEHQAKRQDIQFAIQTAQQAGQFDKAQALQKQLADLDAQIRRESISASRDASAGDLALRDKLGTGALDLQKLAQLIQQQQFGDSLGYDYTKLGTDSDAAALRAIFGD